MDVVLGKRDLLLQSGPMPSPVPLTLALSGKQGPTTHYSFGLQTSSEWLFSSKSWETDVSVSCSFQSLPMSKPSGLGITGISCGMNMGPPRTLCCSVLAGSPLLESHSPSTFL